MKRILFRLFLPAIFFFMVMAIASTYFSVSTGGDAQAIEQRVLANLPTLLLALQVVMLMLLLWIVRRDGLSFSQLGWRCSLDRRGLADAGIGVVVGTALGLLYIWQLSALIEQAQRTLGDYVPPGEILPTLGGRLVPFFIANVVFAPFVEETLYRGYAIPALGRYVNTLASVAIACVFFGLLHWAGGLWYILATGVIVGGVQGALFLWRGTLIAAFMAHLSLNTVEFIYVASH